MKKKYVFFVLIVITLFSARLYYNNVCMDEWIGNYYYFEFLEPNITQTYEVQISKESGKLIAKIKVNGFQTLINWKATLKGNKSEISLIYAESYGDNRGLTLNAGDKVISLKKQDGILYTKLENLEPFNPYRPDEWDETFQQQSFVE